MITKFFKSVVPQKMSTITTQFKSFSQFSKTYPKNFMQKGNNALSFNYSFTQNMNKFSKKTLLLSSIISFYGLTKVYCANATLEQFIEDHEKEVKEHGKLSEKAIEMLFDISLWYQERGLKKDSIRSLEEYVSLKAEKYGKYSEQHSTALVRVSSLFVFFQNYAKAAEFAQRALDCRINLYGEVHRHTGQTYFNLAFMQGMNGQDEQALQNYKKSLEVYNFCPDVEDHQIETSLHSLGEQYMRMGRVKEAIDTFQDLERQMLEKHGEKFQPLASVRRQIELLRKEL